MELESQLAELKYDYIRLQNDLEKKESLNQQIDPLVKQLEEIEKEISDIRSKLRQKKFFNISRH
ncbi:SE1832 family protein [Staphylococcus hominis]